MSFFAFATLVIVGLLLLVLVFMFTFGLMHGHLKNNGESFGAQINNTLDQRLATLEHRVSALTQAVHENG